MARRMANGDDFDDEAKESQGRSEETAMVPGDDFNDRKKAMPPGDGFNGGKKRKDDERGSEQ